MQFTQRYNVHQLHEVDNGTRHLDNRDNKTFTQCLVCVYDGEVLQQSIKVKTHLFVEDVQGFLDTNDYVPGREKDL